MKILCSGDHHFNSRGSRFEECKRIHQQFMVNYARENAVDLFISTGDVFDLANSTTEERAAVSDWLIAMANVCDVLVVDGNHGSAADVELMRKLESVARIVVETGAGVHDFESADGEQLSVASVAWPDRASLLRAADGDASDADQLASVSLQNVLRGLGEQLDGSYNRMLAMHAMVDGSVTSTGQPLIGAEMHVSLAELGLVHASIGVLGHIHKAQHWTYDGADYVYTGSPYRTNYGEIEEKSVLLVEFDEDHNATWQRIPTPASKMLHVTANWIEDEDYETGVVGGWVLGFAPFPVPDTCDAYVRLRCVVAADQRAAAQAACAAWKAECLQDGALDVKVEIEVRPVNSARAPEVARAVTLADKLSAFWSARSTAPEAERAERLIGKAHILESETSHAV